VIGLHAYSAAMDRGNELEFIAKFLGVFVVVMIAAACVYFEWQRRRIAREALKPGWAPPPPRAEIVPLLIRAEHRKENHATTNDLVKSARAITTRDLKRFLEMSN
jgi:hypothetical protein